MLRYLNAVVRGPVYYRLQTFTNRDGNGEVAKESKTDSKKKRKRPGSTINIWQNIVKQ